MLFQPFPPANLSGWLGIVLGVQAETECYATRLAGAVPCVLHKLKRYEPRLRVLASIPQGEGGGLTLVPPTLTRGGR